MKPLTMTHNIAQPRIRLGHVQLQPHPALALTPAEPAPLARMPTPSQHPGPPCMPDDCVQRAYDTPDDSHHGDAAIAVPPDDLHGCTPLHIAAWCGHIGMVESFMAAIPAMAAATTAQGCTPLHLAAFQGHAPVAACLLGHPHMVCCW